MNRVKLLFSIILAISFIPTWRFLDSIAFTWPDSRLYLVCFFFCCLFFLYLPITLAFPKLKRRWPLFGLILISITSWWAGPLSSMATTDPAFSHCGETTYTGLFYPGRKLLTATYEDDLDVRNQLCWVRKLISKLPHNFESYDDLENYMKLLNDKLNRPEIKFRASLPSILFLHGILAGTWEYRNNPVNKIQTDAMLIKQIQFWTEQYTFEISSLEYRWWDWPLAPYIKWEYGLIEKNWQKILEFVNAK